MMTRLFSYVMRLDTGFAPAVDKGKEGRSRFLTLCTCMKKIREIAVKGDWILGTVGQEMARKNNHKKRTFGKVVYLARVTEPPMCFEQYWNDRRFKEQKDRVYRPVSAGRYNGFESESWNPHRKKSQRLNDTKHPRALISERFFYFGSEPKPLNLKWKEFVSGSSKRWRLKYKSFKSEDVDRFIRFVEHDWEQYRNTWREPTSPWQARCRC